MSETLDTYVAAHKTARVTKPRKDGLVRAVTQLTTLMQST